MKHKNFCLGLTLLGVSSFFSSCAGYRITKFTTASIHLGDKQSVIVKKFGEPFRTHLSNDTTIIFYKEAVDVSSYTYILTTSLVFQDSILVKMEQTEEPVPCRIEIKGNGKY